MRLWQALDLIESEFKRAIKKHPRSFNSTHEGYAVLLEELDETWDEIKRNNRELTKKEIVQVGAMVIRFLVDLYPDEPQVNANVAVPKQEYAKGIQAGSVEASRQ